MIQNFKRIVFFFTLMLCSLCFATTGIEDFMPTASGDFVYYRDYTFHTETYVGFVYYDENTYGMRYYAVNPKVGSEEVELLLTLDPSKDVPVITGEKIITQTEQADIESINYLHELLYEFSARRKKQNGKITSETLIVSDEFQQFGGQMTIAYEAYIPIFNLSSIKDKSGEVLFEVQSIGRLVDNEDNSFFDFKVTDDLTKEALFEQELTLSKLSEQTVFFDTISITLDASWERKLENLWALGNSALLSVSKITIPVSEFAQNSYTVQDFFTRQFLLSAKGTALIIPQTTITHEIKNLTVNSLVYTNQENLLSRQIQMLFQSASNDDDYYIVTLTVYEASYRANRAYFDAIVGSVRY